MTRKSSFTKPAQENDVLAALRQHFPNGIVEGNEYKIVRRPPGRKGSLKVNIETGQWKGFSDPDEPAGKDLVSLLAHEKDVSKAAAKALLEGREAPSLGRPKESVEPVAYEGAEPTIAIARHAKLGLPKAIWIYRARTGVPQMVVARYDADEVDEEGRRKKEVLPWVYGKLKGVTAWHNRAFPGKQPLYGLDRLAARPDAPVLCFEGEKTTDAATKLFPDHVSITSQGGSGAPKKADWSPLRGRHVVIWPDHDAAGQHYQEEVGQLAALAGAASVRVVQVPADWPHKWDVADLLPPGVTKLKLRELVQGAPAQLPVIKIIPGPIHVHVTEAEAALAAAGLDVYQRTYLVRPCRHKGKDKDGNDSSVPGLRVMNDDEMIDHLSEAAVFVEGKKWEKIDPPRQVARILLSRLGRWNHLDVLRGVIATPTLRPDGSILNTPGYDARTGLYLIDNPTLGKVAVKDRPTQADARRAIKEIDTELLSGFPFVDEIDRAVALSELITPITRGAVDLAPLHANTAPIRGSGKSYLVDVASALAIGERCPVLSISKRSPGELEKALTAQLLNGISFISIDNVNGELESDLLSQAISQHRVSLRTLGRSETTIIENTTMIYVTGNNVRLAGDLTRRSLICFLDPGVERPELREFDVKPVGLAKTHRARYLSAILTICRAYIVAGRPNKPRPLANFEQWSDLVRGALIWLGYADPVASMEKVIENDPESSALRQIIAAWEAAEGYLARAAPQASTMGATASELATAANYNSFGSPNHPTPEEERNFAARNGLKEALLQVADIKGEVDAKRLGNWFRKIEGRIIGQRRIVKGPTGARGSLVRWKLDRV